MRKALITGGTSKFGAALVKQLEKTYEVEIIPREVISGGEHNISLMDLDGHYNPKHDSYDLVFFNHHAFPEKFDVQTYQRNCLINLRILESINLHKDSKVFWMISSGILVRRPTAEIKDYIQWAPYFAMKGMNVHIMKWLHHMKTYDGPPIEHPEPPRPIANYYAIDPGHMEDGHWDTPAQRVSILIERDDLIGGRVYTLRGQLSDI